MDNFNKRLSTSLPPRKLESSSTILAQNALGNLLKPKFKPNTVKKIKEEPKTAEPSISSTDHDQRNGSNSHGAKRPRFDKPSGGQRSSKFVEGESLFGSGIGDTRRPTSEGNLRMGSGSASRTVSHVFAKQNDFYGIHDERNAEMVQFLSRLPPCHTQPQQLEQLNKLMPDLKERKECPWLQHKVFQQVEGAMQRWKVHDLQKTYMITMPRILVRNETQDFLQNARQYSYNDSRQQTLLQKIMETDDHCLNRATLPSGCLGKMRIYTDGQVEMTLNGMNYHCEERPLESETLLVCRDNKQMKCLTKVERHLEVMLDVQNSATMDSKSTTNEASAAQSNKVTVSTTLPSQTLNPTISSSSIDTNR